MKRNLIFVVLALLALPGWAQQQYKITTINFPGATSTNITGLNDRGQFTGAFFGANSIPHAMRFDGRSLAQFNPDNVFGDRRSFALATNNRGDVVGAFRDAANHSHGFVFSKGVFTQIDFPGATLTQTFGINDQRVMIGIYRIAGPALHAFMLRDGVFTQIDVAGSVNTVPLSINDHDEVVGEWDDGTTVFGHGYLQKPDGRVISTDAPGAGPDGTQFISINDRGQILGAFLDVAGNVHNFVLVRGKFRPFDIAGASAVSAQTINNHGVIVGIVDDAQGEHGFVASPVEREEEGQEREED